MNQSTYFVLTLSEFPTTDLDLATELFFRFEAAGTEQVLPFIQTGREYEPTTLEHETTQLKVYFLQSPSEKLLGEIRNRWPRTTFFVSQDPYRDWLAEWKNQFKPFRLAGDIWIVPSWCEPPLEAQSFLRIDPGMAFGTGSHETTLLASRFLVSHGYQIDTNKSLLDVGTGTGILALLAEKMGFQTVLANDIDPEARRVARENLQLNQSQWISITDASIEEIAHSPESWDWVVANIIDGVLVKIQDSLKKVVGPRGYLLLTGILLEREQIFLNDFQRDGFKLVERQQLGEWVGFLLRRM